MKELNIPYIAGLVLRAMQDDSGAFAQLYAMTYHKIYNYARHYLRDDFLAQDAVQEIYILAFKNLSKLNDPSLFVAWLNRIAFNVCYDMGRKLSSCSAQASDPELLELVEDDHPAADPEASYVRKDEYLRLQQAVADLPFQEKQVVTMRFYNSMKLEEIADACGISRSSVKRYLASAQETLKKVMKN